MPDSPSRVDALLNAVPEGVVVVDAADRVTFVNDRTCALAQTPREQLIGRPVQEIVGGNGWTPAVVTTRAVAERPTERFEYDASFHRADGRDVQVRVVVQPLHTAGGAYDGLIAFLNDVTGHREVEAALRADAERLQQQVIERSNRLQVLEARRVQSEKLAALGQLAAGVAHEINNPLAGIKNGLLLVRDAVPTDHPYRPFIDMMDREVNRITGIVRQLYQVYRPERVARRAVELLRLVEDARQLLAQVLADAGVALHVQVADDLPAIVVPADQLLQVLVHLIQNAVEASPRGGVVELTVAASTTVLSLAVHDDGAGIAPEILPSIFDPFFTTKTVELGLGGMGLGLSVSQSIVQALGGKLFVESEPGHGATFTVALPREGGDPDGGQEPDLSK